jgi:GT2 family glycosyltransferase
VAVASVGVCTINWNQADLVLRAVRSACTSIGVHTSVVVVDNGSESTSIDQLLSGLTDGLPPVMLGEHLGLPVLHRRHCGADVYVVLAGENTGFTGATNTAIEYVFNRLGCDYGFLLNADATLEQEALAKLVECAARNDRVGLVSALILDAFDSSDETISFGGSCVSRFGWPISPYRGKPRSALPPEGFSTTELAGGAALLIPRNVYQRFGGQDNRYFFDVDDAEYSLRVHLAGHRNYIVYGAVVRHAMSSSVRGRRALSRYYGVRNMLLFHRQYRGHRGRWLFWLPFIRDLAKELAVCAIRRDGRRLVGVALAIAHHSRGRYGRGPSVVYG